MENQVFAEWGSGPMRNEFAVEQDLFSNHLFFGKLSISFAVKHICICLPFCSAIHFDHNKLQKPSIWTPGLYFVGSDGWIYVVI